MTQAKQLERFIKQTVGNGLRTAEIQYVHGNTITVRVAGSSKFLRNIPVVGGTIGLLAHDKVVLTEVDGKMAAQRYIRS
jgi:hypothetical protein